MKNIEIRKQADHQGRPSRPLRSSAPEPSADHRTCGKRVSHEQVGGLQRRRDAASASCGAPPSRSAFTASVETPSCRTRRRQFQAGESRELLDLWHEAATQFEQGSRESEVTWNRLTKTVEPLIRERVVSRLRRHRYARCEKAELVQEVYLRLLKGEARVMRACRAQWDAQLLAYLHRITDSVTSDFLRRVRAEKRGRALTYPLSVKREEEYVDPRLDLETSLLSRGELVRFRTAVADCAQRSPRNAVRNARIVELAMIEGRRSCEIGQKMGLGTSSVDSVVSRMRRRLRGQGWQFSRRS